MGAVPTHRPAVGAAGLLALAPAIRRRSQAARAASDCRIEHD
jgi:hypothetical protein